MSSESALWQGKYLDVVVDPEQNPVSGNQIRYAIDRVTGLTASGEPEEIFLLEF